MVSVIFNWTNPVCPLWLRKIDYRLDYCNALLYGVADGVIRQLPSVLRAAARLITGIRRYEHITPTLRDTLHSYITVHHLQNCADDVGLFSRHMSEVLW